MRLRKCGFRKCGFQIVKGWIGAAGEPRQRIYDVAWSGDHKPDADGRLPTVGNTVDAGRATYTNSIGANQLVAARIDPGLRSSVTRVLLRARHRNSDAALEHLRAVRLGQPIPAGLPASIQERAWTWPIWYVPAGGATEGRAAAPLPAPEP